MKALTHMIVCIGLLSLMLLGAETSFAQTEANTNLPKVETGHFNYHGHHYRHRQWVKDHENMRGYWQYY